MSTPPLPRLEVPENAWVFYENVAIHDTDRSGNWRFMIGRDGCFFHSRNQEFYLNDPKLINSDDPDLHWNQPLSDKPIRCLTEEQQAELKQAIETAAVSKLSGFYATPSNVRVSHPSAERWTIIDGNSSYTIIVENGNAPTALVELRKKIDEILAKAPLVD